MDMPAWLLTNQPLKCFGCAADIHSDNATMNQHQQSMGLVSIKELQQGGRQLQGHGPGLMNLGNTVSFAGVACDCTQVHSPQTGPHSGWIMHAQGKHTWVLLVKGYCCSLCLGCLVPPRPAAVHTPSYSIFLLHALLPLQCFMNSCLQCLAYLPALAQACAGASRPLLHGTASPCSLARTGAKCACCMVENLVRELRSGGSGATPARPLAIFQSLPSVFSRSFVRGRQEDAHEFLLAVLDAVERDNKKGLAALGMPKVGTALVAALVGYYFYRGRLRKAMLLVQSCAVPHALRSGCSDPC